MISKTFINAKYPSDIIYLKAGEDIQNGSPIYINEGKAYIAKNSIVNSYKTYIGIAMGDFLNGDEIAIKTYGIWIDQSLNLLGSEKIYLDEGFISQNSSMNHSIGFAISTTQVFLNTIQTNNFLKTESFDTTDASFDEINNKYTLQGYIYDINSIRVYVGGLRLREGPSNDFIFVDNSIEFNEELIISPNNNVIVEYI